MTNDEYQQYVEYATENYIKIPRFLVCDCSNWRHRSTLARFLFREEQFIPAIDLFKSIVDIEIDNNDVESGDLENKVWCLTELSISMWQYQQNLEKALMYIDMAIELMNSYKYKFDFVVRGEVWRSRWEILKVSGQVHLAKKEINEKISAVMFEDNKSNSILFHGLSFLAEVSKSNNDNKKANYLLVRALRYFPHQYDDIKQLDTIIKLGHSNLDDTYQELLGLTHHEMVWEEISE